MAGQLNQKSLIKRSLSALVLAPLTVLIVFMGGWYLKALLLLVGGVCLYEWLTLSLKSPRKIMLSIAGLLYIPAAFVACWHIYAGFGAMLALLFVVMVWASDVGAYFSGKLFGRAKLLEEISPNKTWVGFGGAVLSPMLVALVYIILNANLSVNGLQTIAVLLGAGIMIGLAGQWGDLIVSSLKRIVGVKDSGHLIPGHGGLLDRLDSLLLCAPFFLLFMKVFADVFTT